MTVENLYAQEGEALCLVCHEKVLIETAVIEKGCYAHPGCLENREKTVKCTICGEEREMLTYLHLKQHNLTCDEYKFKYGPVVSKGFSRKLSNLSPLKRTGERGLFITQTQLNGLSPAALKELEFALTGAASDDSFNSLEHQMQFFIRKKRL